MKGECPECNSSDWNHEFPDIGVCKNCGHEWDLTGFPIGPIPEKGMYGR